MSYATIEQLIRKYGRQELVQLTDRATPPSDRVDNAVAQDALQEATNLIDGYVGAVHALPLVEVPALLGDLCCAIARFTLFNDRASEEVRARYDDAIKTLRDISTGKIKLQVAAGDQPARVPDVIAITSEERIFSRTKMRGL